MILCLIRIYFQPAVSLVPTSHACRPCRAQAGEGRQEERRGEWRAGSGRRGVCGAPSGLFREEVKRGVLLLLPREGGVGLPVDLLGSGKGDWREQPGRHGLEFAV